MTEAEWLSCDEPTPLLETLGAMSARKQLLFGVACCRRIAHQLADRRAANGLALVEMFVDGAVDLATLTSIQTALGDAINDAFGERYGAEAEANWCSHPADSAAWAMERAAYAVGGLFDQAVGEQLTQERGSPTFNDRRPHEQAALAAYYHAESFIHWVYGSRPADKQRSPSYKVASVLCNQVRLSEAEAQAAILRDIIGNPFRPVAFDPLWRSETVVLLARQMYESRDFSAMPILADALEDQGCGDENVLGHCRGPGQHMRGCHILDLVLGKA